MNNDRASGANVNDGAWKVWTWSMKNKREFRHSFHSFDQFGPKTGPEGDE